MSLRRVLAIAVPFVLLGAGPALAKPAPKPTTPATYDVSYPQCGGALPSGADGGIVGVNGGRVYTANPCLTSEWAWATKAAPNPPALYANTGDPGPAVSTKWPTGQTSPQACSATDPNSTACSYDYGWNAAKDSYADAVASGTAGAGAAWWLDVETGNSWETLESQYGQTAAAKAADTASLQGAAAALHDSGLASVGFYSTSYQWGQITGGTGATFAGNAAWVAGVGSLATAQANCTTTSFTGGRIQLTQYAKNGYDADNRC